MRSTALQEHEHGRLAAGSVSAARREPGLWHPQGRHWRPLPDGELGKGPPAPGLSCNGAQARLWGGSRRAPLVPASALGQHRLCCACHPATSPLGRARLVFPTKTWRTCTRSGAPRCCLSGCPRRGPGAWGMTVTANGTYCWCPVRIWPCDGSSPVKRGVSLSLKESSSWWKANKIPP